MSNRYFSRPKIILGQIILIGCLGAGISVTALHANRIDSPGQNQPITLIDQSGIEQRALDKIARKDSGRAQVYYNRRTHVLHFVILNMWSVPAFKSKKVRKQTKKFKKLTHISDVTSSISISSEAKKREAIRLKENKQQAIQDKIDEQKAIEHQREQAAQQKANQAIKAKIKKIKQAQQNRNKQRNKVQAELNQQLKSRNKKHKRNNRNHNRRNHRNNRRSRRHRRK